LARLAANGWPIVSLPFASFSCMAAAKMRAEFNAQIAELRRELLAHRDACVAQIKTVFETEGHLVEARAELSKLQMLEASRSGSDTTRLN
jgi:flagellar biosynthesis chaperone FliJ